MTTALPPATWTGPTTSQLIDSAVNAGLLVCWTPPHYPRQAAYAHAAGTIWLRRDLTDAEARSLLAHELGHYYYGDDGPQPSDIEARAWRWAARLLITDGAYAVAEQLEGPSVPGLAEQLQVTREVVTAYQSLLRRIA